MEWIKLPVKDRDIKIRMYYTNEDFVNKEITIEMEEIIGKPKKYYVPDIEDIRVGYECEANLRLVGSSQDEWRTTIMKGIGQDVIHYHSQGVYRTPYLTKEQIEGEGWIDNETGWWIKKPTEEFLNFHELIDYNNYIELYYGKNYLSILWHTIKLF